MTALTGAEIRELLAGKLDSDFGSRVTDENLEEMALLLETLYACAAEKRLFHEVIGVTNQDILTAFTKVVATGVEKAHETGPYSMDKLVPSGVLMGIMIGYKWAADHAG